jgi:hypothetical protein
MLYKKFQFVAQIVGFVTIGLLAVYGLVSILGGGTALAAALGQTPVNKPDAVIPSTFNYQGLLRNSDGSLTTGTYTITAKIYDAATGGSVLYTEMFPSVIVRDGLFNVVLGDNPLGQNLQNVFSATPRYVGLTLANQSGELIPRQRVHGVPWALYATNASQATDFTASGNIATANLTASGNIAAANLNAASLTVGGAATCGSLIVNGAVSVKSTTSSYIYPGDGWWGDWYGWTYCPNGTFVCGAQVRIEAMQGDIDDSAMNGIQLACCKLGN